MRQQQTACLCGHNHNLDPFLKGRKRYLSIATDSWFSPWSYCPPLVWMSILSSSPQITTGSMPLMCCMLCGTSPLSRCPACPPCWPRMGFTLVKTFNIHMNIPAWMFWSTITHHCLKVSECIVSFDLFSFTRRLRERHYAWCNRLPDVQDELCAGGRLRLPGWPHPQPGAYGPVCSCCHARLWPSRKNQRLSSCYECTTGK